MAKSIIKESKIIRNHLDVRINKELNLTLSSVSKDAYSKGMKITVSDLSRYFGRDKKKPNKKENDNALMTEEKILWLCLRYGIPISLTVGNLVLNKNGGVHFNLPIYNESTALDNLFKKFPWPNE